MDDELNVLPISSYIKNLKVEEVSNDTFCNFYTKLGGRLNRNNRPKLSRTPEAKRRNERE